MCSIAYGRDTEAMLSLMAHRGPDDSGIVDGLGMGRLAIIDLKSDGLCPFHDNGKVLAFNGEIYNYKELRDKHGLECRTDSDTEVLFRMLETYSVPYVLNELNGMFAFAYYDGRVIVVARDIAGEKPLYYTEDPFEFASENKALGFKGIELPPAHYGIYANGVFHMKRWWELKTRSIDPTTAESELEHLLEDSVRLRTQSDVPYGLYYSGGVDSTLIGSFHNFEHKFTYDDSQFTEREFIDEFPKILWHLDGPVESFSPFGLWQLSKQAKAAGVKVVLSGEGADELFGGYVRYLPQSLYREAQQHYPSYKKYFPYEKDVNQLGWDEFNGNMRELLRMGDRMAAAFGIENRCPFLDRRIIEFAFSLPPELKIQGFDTKVLLNKVLRKRIPTYQPIEKQGLYVSVNKWLGEPNSYDKKAYKGYQEKVWKSLVSA